MGRIVTGYLPRKWQEYAHAHIRRFNVMVVHRRAGKSVFAINEMIDQGLRCQKRNPQYFYLAPTYGQAKRVAWTIIKDAVRNIPGVSINEAELRVDIPRKDDFIRFMLLGAENPDSLRGLYADGVILDEVATMAPETWTQVVRPTLSDRRGWAIFISTPKGANHFQKLYLTAKDPQNMDWFGFMLTAADSGILPEEELRAAQLTMSPEEYSQEFLCSFTAALVGAYFGKEMAQAEKDNRVISFPIETGYPVDVSFDLGMDDSTAIWFVQQVGREIRAIDYMEVSGKGLPEIVKLLREKPYVYRDFYLPHDISVRELSLDRGKTRLDTLISLKLGNKEQMVVIPRIQKKEDAIHAARMLIPRMVFHKDNCAYGIEALKSYERVFDSKEQVFKARPRHNWASHGADGFQTLAMGFRADYDRGSKEHLPSMADMDYDIFGV
jgi:hypothetical protein